ncbi:MAG: penicillin-binding protein 2 [Patescibacteria group bacterium]|nr:penicillin-binding protein 2 [Patescibacteria group bacterium]
MKVSRKEQKVTESEAWSVAILPGSGENRSGSEMSFSHLKWFVVVAGIVSSVLLVQLFNLQVVQGARNQSLADGNRIRQNVIRPPRGAIYDSRGELLARNVANFDLVAIAARMPRKAEERQLVYERLSKIVGQPAEEIKRKVEKDGVASPLPALVQESVPRDIALVVEEQKASLPGVDLDTNPIREYLDGGQLAHFLGYTGRVSAEDLEKEKEYRPTDYIGKVGIERAYEKDLRGEAGAEQSEVDATGKPIKVLASKDPVAGNSLKLTVNFGLQKAMSEALARQVSAAGSGRGAAIAMDPRNGQILAAVNYPSYDNNLFAQGIKQDVYQNLLNDQNRPLFNKISGGSYPIGSVIKPFVSAAALQENVINTSTIIKDEGKLVLPNRYDPSIVQEFSSWRPEGLGNVDIYRALAMSSNVFYYTVGGGYQNFQGLGVTRLLDYYKKFGFGSKTGLDIGDETGGFLPSPESKKKSTGENWYVGDTYNLSIGQGNFMASPLQLVSAISSIANGGTLYKPYFVKEVVNEDGQVVRSLEPEVVRSNFINPEHLSTVQKGMREVIVSGTGCCSTNREVPVAVAGKTGTAETSSAGLDGTQRRTKPHAWFEAYAPYENPEIAIVALIEYAGEGSEFALPVVRDSLKWYFTEGKK